MALKKYKPTSPGRRGAMGYDFSMLDKKKPEKSLLESKTSKVGRGSAGKITTRHRGGGVKRRYRTIDFRMDKFNVPAKVVAIEYDPNRTSFIALLVFADGEKRYIIAPEGLKKEDIIISSENAPVKVGNRLPVRKIPVGTFIHGIEIIPGKGAQMIRSAGSFAKLMAIEGKFAHISLASGETKIISADAFASIGQVSNIDHNKVVLGKAGRSRWLGRRPQVRGTVMNPNDHPHGGGEGRQPIGLKHPKTPWGKPALGKKTRKKNKRPLIKYKKKEEDKTAVSV